MKKKWIRFCLPTGLLISVLFRFIEEKWVVSDYIAYPVLFISIALMLIGIAYTGWCLGKGKNPNKP